MKKQNQVLEALRYLKESRNYVFLSVGLFLLSGIFAFIFPSLFTFFNPLLMKLSQSIEGLSASELIIFIFKNNVTSAFSALFLGIFLGVVPVFNAIINGALVGYVFSRASAVEGLSSIWKLVPHGIFELPAIFISLGLGVRLGMFIFAKHKKKTFVQRFVHSMWIFVIIVVPLLIIAAFIEGFLIAFSK